MVAISGDRLNLTQATGRRPVGYRAPAWEFSRYTLGQIQAAGFLYDSSMMGSDDPYEILLDGKPITLRSSADAVKRGVRVHLMVPGEHTDSRILRRASQHLYKPLLLAGVRLYEFHPTLLHQKIVIVDQTWSHIGSTNFDARSLALNAEIGVGLLDRNIAKQLREAFEQDLKRSRELTLDQWQRRHWYQRLIDWCAYQLHDQI